MTKYIKQNEDTDQQKNGCLKAEQYKNYIKNEKTLFQEAEQNDEYYMTFAIQEAKKAYKKGDVPVGCVIVKNGKIIARGYNKKEKKKCSLYHAEIVAIKNACKRIGDWRLNDCKMFVTMEPCAMCAGAIVNHRIKTVVVGITEPNFGACGSGIDILNNSNLNTKTTIITGILQDECKQLLQEFFKERRKA